MPKSNTFVAIIDYQMSNLFSVRHAFEFIGVEAVITSDNNVIMSAAGIILPGVGAFGEAMENLKRLGLVEGINNYIKTGRPFLGVCLGMQLLFSESEEFGKHKGLGIIQGKVVKFPDKNADGEFNRIPQIGWNRINKSKVPSNWDKTPLRSTKDGEFMYFVHSFYTDPKDKKVITALTNYNGLEYCSSLVQKNVFAVQFHPEKSGPNGINIYKKWSQYLKRN
ncbi:MAG: imidazole glycerol phosphate synthase subunit HisH [Bacteroidota bacterium]|jgi:glutamine amidotransferase